MEMQLILTTFIASIGLTPAQPIDQVDKRVITSNVHGDIEVQENFRRFFDSMTKNDMKDTKTYRNILEQVAAREQTAFDTMKDDFHFARQRKAHGHRNNVYNEDDNEGHNVVIFKREVSDSPAVAEKDVKDVKTADPASVNEGAQPNTNQPKPPSTPGDVKEESHSFVEKVQAAIDSKHSKVMHTYLKELMRQRINLDKIKDDLQDVTYDDPEEIKGLKEFLEYLDRSINHGLECLHQGLNEDRKGVASVAPGVSEAPKIQFTVQPIDKSIVLNMIDSIRSLKTCLRDQKKRCKRLYAEAKEAIVVAQERLTEAVEAYTDLLQHIEGKPYVKPDTKLEEEDDKDDDDSRSG